MCFLFDDLKKRQTLEYFDDVFMMSPLHFTSGSDLKSFDPDAPVVVRQRPRQGELGPSGCTQSNSPFLNFCSVDLEIIGFIKFEIQIVWKNIVVQIFKNKRLLYSNHQSVIWFV